MNDAETVKQIIQLCELGLYDEAMATTYKIDNISASISAYLLVMECKERLDSSEALGSIMKTGTTLEARPRLVLPKRFL